MKAILFLFALIFSLTANADEKFIKESDAAKKIAHNLNDSVSPLQQNTENHISFNKNHQKLLQHLSVYKKQKTQKLKKKGYTSIQHKYHFSQNEKNQVNAKIVTNYTNRNGQPHTEADHFQYNTNTQKTIITKKNAKYNGDTNQNLMSNKEFSATLKNLNTKTTQNNNRAIQPAATKNTTPLMTETQQN